MVSLLVCATVAKSSRSNPNIVDTREKPLIISVIGGGNPSARALQLASSVGQELAKAGVMVVCGGLSGVMEAVCKGAKSAGGTTIGILPGNSPQEGNKYIDIPICTGMGYARNVIVVKTGRAVIAIDGSFGTLSEIGHALGDNIPVIGLETWDLGIGGIIETSIIRANTPIEAVRLAVDAAYKRDD